MIEIKLNDIIQNIDFFQKLAKQQLPAITAFKISKIIKRITEEYNIYQTVRNQLIDKYGEKNEDGSIKTEGNNIIIQADKINDCQKELDDLLNTDIQIDAQLIEIEELNNNLTFSPAQMVALSPFINQN